MLDNSTKERMLLATYEKQLSCNHIVSCYFTSDSFIIDSENFNEAVYIPKDKRDIFSIKAIIDRELKGSLSHLLI